MSHILYYRIEATLFKSGDQNAFSRVWQSMEPLVHKQLRSIQLKGNEVITLDDFISSCQVAVWKALKCFNPRKNPNFLTFAMEIVRRAICDQLSLLNRSSRIYAKLLADVNSIDDTVDEYAGFFDRCQPWSWISQDDSELIYGDVMQTLEGGLIGRSREIFELRFAGYPDKYIKKELNLGLVEYLRAIEVMLWQVQFILSKKNLQLEF